MWLTSVLISTGVGVAAADASSSGGMGLEVYGPLGVAVAALAAVHLKADKREADRADRLEALFVEFLPRLLQAVELLNAESSKRTR